MIRDLENFNAVKDPTTEKLMTGTTTIGMVIGDGVLMATESQATAGYMVATKIAQKLFQINDYAAATISGGVADCQYVVNQAQALSRLRELKMGDTPDILYVANTIKNILFSGRSLFLSMMLVGGWSVRENAPKLFGVDLLGTLFTEEKFIAFGSGSTFALGVLEADWKDKLSLEEAKALAIRGLTAARNRDAASGYGIQIAHISAKGFEWIEKPAALQ
ncbi:MAG: proteasome subunit beta [Promethearchaeota archaeon]